jgi:hypothetical protein
VLVEGTAMLFVVQDVFVNRFMAYRKIAIGFDGI